MDNLNIQAKESRKKSSRGYSLEINLVGADCGAMADNF